MGSPFESGMNLLMVHHLGPEKYCCNNETVCFLNIFTGNNIDNHKNIFKN